MAFLEDGSRHVLLMSSAGHIYYQPLCEESSARHGSFYVTNIMDVPHPELGTSSEQICGGGVSIFYCHSLQLLFFRYGLSVPPYLTIFKPINFPVTSTARASWLRSRPWVTS